MLDQVSIGCITPENTGRFSFYWSPSEDLRGKGIFPGLAAFSEVPGFTWFQRVVCCLSCELTGGFGYDSDQFIIGFITPESTGS